MSNLKDNIISRAMDSAAALTVRSALNPALWLYGIVTVPALIIAGLHENPPVWLIVVICSPIVMTVVGFLFLLFFDRDRLQSESYQLRKQSLELIEQKGDLKPIDASTIEVISNPDYKALSNDMRGAE